ncbi:MAG: SUMF1/EgtB/PvdO family nonheme iron enzyme, partial [Candidatus Roizmanbacteria bacterium]|nr:SUMF1/EgtB/PvdO family nonheme iron enzyme [Candidatus Roizmanbacteria bacterium]
PKGEFQKFFNFLSIEWDKRIEKEIFEKTTETRNRQDPYTTYVKKENVKNFTEILSLKEATDIREICALSGINLENPETEFFERTSFSHLTTQGKDRIPIKKVDRTLLVQEAYKSAKYVPYDESGLYVAETPATNFQFAQFLDWLIEQNFPIEINGRPLFYNDRPQSRIHIDNKIVSIEKGYENHPATFVTWFGAAIFSIWLGGRLPTQKEWEKAIFTKSSELKPEQIIFSKEHENVAQYYGDTTPVRFFPPNQFGVYDEIGNVSIWLSNPEDKNPFEKLKAGLEWNHSDGRGIFPNPRPHWLGTSGLGIRVVFDKIGKNLSDSVFTEELRNVVKFLMEKKHTNIQEANLELFRKIRTLFKKEII